MLLVICNLFKIIDWKLKNEKTFRDLGYRIMWDNLYQNCNKRDKTRKAKV